MYIVILGCGRVGAELANLLSIEGHDVVVVDKHPESFSRLGDAFNGLTVVGNGVFTRVLQDAGIERADIFCSLTNSDNINIMASQVARGIFKVKRVISLIYDPRKAVFYKSLGLDVLNETGLFASMLRDKITDKILSGYLIETNELGVMEFPVTEEFFGKRVEEMSVPHEFNITAIRYATGGVFIPDAKTVVAKGDVVLGVVRMRSVDKIKKMFKL
jgi:trk system potassium uptake protein TrkA